MLVDLASLEKTIVESRKDNIDISSYRLEAMSAKEMLGYIDTKYFDDKLTSEEIIEYMSAYNKKEFSLRLNLLETLFEGNDIARFESFLALDLYKDELYDESIGVPGIKGEQDYVLVDLLGGDDIVFIKNLYINILKRRPDISGFLFNTDKLRENGVSRLRMILDFYYSDERVFNQPSLKIRRLWFFRLIYRWPFTAIVSWRGSELFNRIVSLVYRKLSS